MKRVKPVVGQFYHVYNRGVDKRVVFLEEIDYIRFIHDLYEFNDGGRYRHSGSAAGR